MNALLLFLSVWLFGPPARWPYADFPGLTVRDRDGRVLLNVQAFLPSEDWRPGVWVHLYGPAPSLDHWLTAQKTREHWWVGAWVNCEAVSGLPDYVVTYSEGFWLQISDGDGGVKITKLRR